MHDLLISLPIFKSRAFGETFPGGCELSVSHLVHGLGFRARQVMLLMGLRLLHTVILPQLGLVPAVDTRNPRL